MLRFVSVLALALALVCGPAWVSSFSANAISKTPSANAISKTPSARSKTPSAGEDKNKIKNCCEAGICCVARNNPR